MFGLLTWAIIFIISMFVLIKASDYFTDSAERIGIFFGLPAFLIGVTIVSIGTSLPELITSLFAVLRNSSEIVVSNVIGSNIANIFLVLGVSAIVGKRLKIGFEIIRVDLPILIGSAFLLAVTIYDGIFTLPEALLCIAGIIIYLTYTVKTEKKHPDIMAEKEMKTILKTKKLNWTTWIILITSSLFIYLGAKYTIESVIALSEILNIGKEIIAAGAIALGTSLPELVVSVNAARKGKAEIAVGNVLGSCIFNSLAVMGISALIGSLIVPPIMISFGLPMMLIATFLYFFMTQTKEITRWEGMILLLFYVFYIGKLMSLF
ncbi:calcium/sodium antiporter [Candidatus Woesearchaeota archaeon]|nr:calcium/sodium antiporter [Candidatus Woesearchaeota archaeon]MBL7051036.1 calcium/sodium antiporter [Candidatus Woesearchaeota archaeon]